MYCVRVIHELVPHWIREIMLKATYTGKEKDSVDFQDNFFAYMKATLENACLEADAETYEKTGNYWELHVFWDGALNQVTTSSVWAFRGCWKRFFASKVARCICTGTGIHLARWAQLER